GARAARGAAEARRGGGGRPLPNPPGGGGARDPPPPRGRGGGAARARPGRPPPRPADLEQELRAVGGRRRERGLSEEELAGPDRNAGPLQVARERGDEVEPPQHCVEPDDPAVLPPAQHRERLLHTGLWAGDGVRGEAALDPGGLALA